MAATLELVIKGVDNASGVFKNVDKSASGLSKTVGTVLKAGALAGVAALGALAVGSIKFIGAASDLEESVNKSKVVFGDFADEVTDFAKTSAQSFGISRSAAHSYTATLGTILKGSGLAGDATAEMSVGMVKLAADMASFNNIPIDQALEKIRAGLVGESEPLRTVGVLLSEAAVQEKAYAAGIAETGAKLTDAQKVQARYQLIMEQTRDTQGDFTRTSGSLANQTRILGAEWENVQAILGRAMLPTVTRLAQAFTKFLADHEDEIEQFSKDFEHFAEETMPKVEAAVEDVAQAMALISDVVVPTTKALKDLDEMLDGELSQAFLNSLPIIREWRAAMNLKAVVDDARTDFKGFVTDIATSTGPIGQAKDAWEGGGKALDFLGVKATDAKGRIGDYTLSVEEADRLQGDLISSGEDLAGVVGDLGGAMGDTKSDIDREFIPGLKDGISTMEDMQKAADETRKRLFNMFKEPTQEEQIAEAALANYRLELARIEVGLPPLTQAQKDYLDSVGRTGDEAAIAELMERGLTRADAERAVMLDTQVIPKSERELELLQLTRDAAKEQADVKFAQSPKQAAFTKGIDDEATALSVLNLRMADVSTIGAPQLWGSIDGVRVILGDAMLAAAGFRDTLYSIPANIKTKLDLDILRSFIEADPAGVAPIPRAMGGITGYGETTLVGEHGPEIAAFPTGTRIFDAEQTQRLLQTSSTGDTFNISLQYSPQYVAAPETQRSSLAEAERMADMVVAAARRKLRY
jgi:hypothetical protein